MRAPSANSAAIGTTSPLSRQPHDYGRFGELEEAVWPWDGQHQMHHGGTLSGLTSHLFAAGTGVRRRLLPMSRYLSSHDIGSPTPGTTVVVQHQHVANSTAPSRSAPPTVRSLRNSTYSRIPQHTVL